ncbi:hypothetical protein [Natronobacterium texcoconense]|uniref:Uncharacterized protein n=1 Tax=Natronobacterium texcoconense TaxID=1095778 RepID=A0A1H1FVT0_NATTX|nr:hypothetical protein [Natronobacterium texcoconense]SDR05093.1 hypothetical protein SAMN04489842_2139 [Natronobacterium texcoconense]
MVSRRSVLLALVLLGAVLVGVGFATGTPEPVLTIENDDNVSYQVTAYTVEDLDAAGYLNFEVTTDDGEQRLVTYNDLVWTTSYQNVTLVDEGVNSQSFTVGPNETTTGVVDGWSHGDVTLYIVESDDDETRTWSRTVTCDSRGQDHGLRMAADSGGGGSTHCGGGFGWMIR